MKPVTNADIGERVRAVEVRVEQLVDNDIPEIKETLAELKESVTIFTTEMARYKGIMGALFLMASAVGTLIWKLAAPAWDLWKKFHP